MRQHIEEHVEQHVGTVSSGLGACCHAGDGGDGSAGGAVGDLGPSCAGERVTGQESMARPGPVDAGPVLTCGLTGAVRALRGAMGARPVMVGAGEGELVASLATVSDLRSLTEQVTVQVLAEALTRGLPTVVGLSAHDWTAMTCPWLSRAEITDLVITTQALTHPDHGPIVAALEAGVLPLRRAARLVRALDKVRSVSSSEAYVDAVRVLVPVATDLGYSDRDLRVATDHLVAVALPEKLTEARERALHDLRAVHTTTSAEGDLTRVVITADPEGAATIAAILSSPLAAPAPDADGLDPRTATQRHYDALLTVLGRGVACPQGVTTTTKAQVMITMGLDALTGQLSGLGHTLTGQTLAPSTVRKIACTAGLIPTLLGSDSQILDLGRTTRLATPAQHRALWHRDRHCSYPGCTVPPQWCDAHHVTYWSRGGSTDLANLVLLCPRHHTLVHQHDHDPGAGPPGLHAVVTPTGTTWRHQDTPVPHSGRQLVDV